MSDALVTRWDEYVESMGCVMGEVEHMAQLMRDRIKELETEARYWSGEMDVVLAGRADEADRADRAEAKLAKVVAAYRIEVMRRDGYTHDAFDRHISELTGGKDE